MPGSSFAVAILDLSFLHRGPRIPIELLAADRAVIPSSIRPHSELALR